MLTDLEYKSIYANQEAVQTLTFPMVALPASREAHFQNRLRAILGTERFTRQQALVSFLSGRRRYSCRSLLLESVERPPLVVVMLERCAHELVALSEAGPRFHLSPRECETLQCLAQGLSNKEIAERMHVSPNTIKQFVRLVMSKMGATTRLGIICRLRLDDHEAAARFLRG